MNAVYLIATVLAIAGQNIMKKVFNLRTGGGVYFFTLLSAAAAMLFFLVTGGKPEFSAALLPYSAAFGTAYAVAVVFSVMAVSCGSLSLTTLINSYSLMLPTFYGLLFLREPVSTGLIPGLGLLIVSLVLVNKKTESTPITPKWVISVVLAFVGNGFCSIFQKMQQSAFDGAFKNEFMILALVMVVAVMAVLALVSERRKLKNCAAKGWWCCLAGGTLNGVTNLFVMILSGTMAVSLMFPVISAGGIIVTFFVSRWLYHEKLTRRQLVGFALGVLSVIFLNL